MNRPRAVPSRLWLGEENQENMEASLSHKVSISVIVQCVRAVAITSRKHVTKHFRVAKKVLCSMATEGKSVSNSRSLRNIRWIYPAR